MASLWEPERQQELYERITRLQADTPRRWGTMNAGQMLQHLDRAYKNAMGVLPVSKIFWGFITSLTPVKKLMIYKIPWKKNLPTAPEYVVADAVDFDAARAAFLESLQIITTGDVVRFAAHPIFGQLSYEDWGALLYKHTDHHLRQFGV